MPFFLKHRETELKELMDDPHCDLFLLFNTYAQFKQINQYFSGWRTIYKKWIRPYALKNPNCSVLDVGCGGGDVMLMLAQWAKKDGITITCHGIDPDPHAMAYIKTQTFPANVSFSQSSLKSLLQQPKRYDFVISNHILHHLTTSETIALLEEAQQACLHQVIFNDICRSDLAYGAFSCLSALFYRDSFAHYDGCLSIQRSYTLPELRAILPPSWQVQTQFPYRLLITYEHTS
jgi:2-polyprenyl-3-methyl-5-hydroxy-6-metoxy-1,4-benzoquinol methylase